MGYYAKLILGVIPDGDPYYHPQTDPRFSVDRGSVCMKETVMALAKYKGQTWNVSSKLPYENNPMIVMLEREYPIIPRKIVLDNYSKGIHRTTAKIGDIEFLDIPVINGGTLSQ